MEQCCVRGPRLSIGVYGRGLRSAIEHRGRAETCHMCHRFGRTDQLPLVEGRMAQLRPDILGWGGDVQTQTQCLFLAAYDMKTERRDGSVQ